MTFHSRSMLDASLFLKQANVALNKQQIELIQQINLTLTDLRNINVSTPEFAELCEFLKLSFGAKIKLKSAIISLRDSHTSSAGMITYNTNKEIQTEYSNVNLDTQWIYCITTCLIAILIILYFNRRKRLKSEVMTASVPIGCIIGWHKDFCEKELALPGSWIECNGQTINDEKSIFHNETVPNLNGERRFLRGDNASGKIEEDQLKKHTHNGHFQITGGVIENVCWNLGARSSWCSGPVSETGGDETRPKNMSVVWIMKIK